MPIVYNRHSTFGSWYAGVVTFGLDNIPSASAMTTTHAHCDITTYFQRQRQQHHTHILK